MPEEIVRPTRGCRRLGQGSASERWNAVLEFLLKYQLTSRGEAKRLSHQPLGNYSKTMRVIEMRKSNIMYIVKPLIILTIITLGCSSINRLIPSTTSTNPIITDSPIFNILEKTITNTPTITNSSTPTKSGTPTLTMTSTPINEYKLDIPANIVWYNTKILLKIDQMIEITATGKSNISGQPNHDNWEPDGDQGNCPSDCLLPGVGYGTLIGKIAGELPFKVGSYFREEVKTEGILLLAINDNEPYYFDNTGSYQVIINIWQ